MPDKKWLENVKRRGRRLGTKSPLQGSGGEEDENEGSEEVSLDGNEEEEMDVESIGDHMEIGPKGCRKRNLEKGTMSDENDETAPTTSARMETPRQKISAKKGNTRPSTPASIGNKSMPTTPAINFGNLMLNTPQRPPSSAASVASSSSSKGGRPKKRQSQGGRPRKDGSSSREPSRDPSPMDLDDSRDSSFATPHAGRKAKRPGTSRPNAGRPKRSRITSGSIGGSVAARMENIQNMPEFELEFPENVNVHGRIFDAARMVMQVITDIWYGEGVYFDEGSVYAFTAFLSSLSARRAIVISPHFTSSLHRFQEAPDVRDLCYNFADDWEVALMPINHPAHFTLLIYERQEQTAIFYNTYPAMDVGGPHDQFMVNSKCAIVQLTGIEYDQINVQKAPENTFNLQADGWSCGLHVCLIAEAYLLNNRNTWLDDLDIGQEKKRVLWHVSQLFRSDHPQYHPRQEMIVQPYEDYDERTVQCDEPEIDREPEPLIPERRSERIKNRVVADPVPIPSKSATKDLKPITTKCHLTHKDYSCADVRAGHTVEYYSSGKLGDAVCIHCEAELFASEVSEAHKWKKVITSNYCCYCGTVQLPPYQEHPKLLRDLSSGETPESKEFLSKENIYNSLLAFSSISVGHKDSSMGGGVCFMLNGEFKRQMSSMFPGHHEPSFSQLYILDPATACDQRSKNTRFNGDKVDKKTLEKLDKLLREVHPFAKEYLNFHTQYQRKLDTEGPEAVANFRMTLLEAREAPKEIRDPKLHPHLTNLPIEGENLFALWTEQNDAPRLKGIWITDAQGELHEYYPKHPQTDTLCYPILFPCGDDGFHKNIPVHRPKPPQKNAVRSSSAPPPSAPPQNDSDEEIGSDNDDASSVAGSTASLNDGQEGNNRKVISMRMYIRHRLAIRKGETFHNIWNAGGGLSQRLVLDYAARIDSEVADFLRRPELNLRTTLPDHYLNWLARSAKLNSKEEIGKVVMFRKNQPGTRPYFQDMYYDATTIMARVRRPGYATYMFTYTCNPGWPEIAANLARKGQKTVDRCDLICRVYEDKLRKLHYLMDKKNIFGKIRGYGESREFQKKYGGPHLHRVFHSDHLAIPENIENLIWAHIPKEPEKDDHSSWANFIRKIRELLPKYQMHDCSEHCRNARGKCKKGFPKNFSNETVLYDDKPAQYKRPSPDEGGERLTVKRSGTPFFYDNSRVVPYNPLILVLFETHHNLEYAYGQSDNLKYCLKYPFKGQSFSYVQCQGNNAGKTDVDEPAHYSKMLYRSAPEAFSRIMGYKYAILSHTVIPLNIHLPGQQTITIRPGRNQELEDQIATGTLPDTPLIAYWKQWGTDKTLEKILFENMPETHSFNTQSRSWKKRIISAVPAKAEKRKPIIGRIRPVSPREQPEKFALYILMKHFPGDPEHLKTVNGQVCDTFIEAARLRGLIEDNDVWIRTLEEGSASLMPNQMRQLFANILIFGSSENCIIDGKALWEKFLNFMYDHRKCTEAQKAQRIDRALAVLERLLMAQGKQLADFNLPKPKVSLSNDPAKATNEFFFPDSVNDDEIDESVDVAAYVNAQLNKGQQEFWELIANAAMTPASDTNIIRLHNLLGNAGTGKTWLLNYIIYNLRQKGVKVMATAPTGIASTKFYAGGMTYQSAFRLGINNEPGIIPSVAADSFFGRRIMDAQVIVLDEQTMLDKVVFENGELLTRTMATSHKDTIFAGKVVIISGDAKQSLPVVVDSYCAEAQVAACIQSSHLYPHFKKYKLTENMRVNAAEIAWMEFLNDVGTGTSGDRVKIPKEMIVQTREELYKFVFDQGFSLPSDQMLTRLLLAPTNILVDLNNAALLRKLPSPMVDYYSVDKATEENPFAVNAAAFDVAQLNRLTPPGMPAHHLQLKVGAIIMLLVNLNTSKGLCNGTRLLVKKLTPNLIEAETVTNSNKGTRVGISRVRTNFVDKRAGGVSFERMQFPVRIAFTMTITKSQGQTCKREGIDFSSKPFAHGHVYTALSRATSKEGIKIYAPKMEDDKGDVWIKNVVAKGVEFD